ncbi:MAG: cytochrome c [Ramlibacter sp.]
MIFDRKVAARHGHRALVLAALLGMGAMAHAQLLTAPSPTRGQLLYNTHCIACHTTQMHWRDDRQATDWDSLKVQVRRWQGNAGLAWTDEDITDVARHLNNTIYKFSQTADRVSQATYRKAD